MMHKPEIFFLEGIKAEGFHTIGAENGLVGIQQVQEKSPMWLFATL